VRRHDRASLHPHLTYSPLPDKIEDARAKAAIKAQIEADKKARAEKFAREKALRDGQPVPESIASTSAGPSAPALPTGTIVGKEFKDTRLQIRMATGGQPYTTSLPSDASTCSFSSPVRLCDEHRLVFFLFLALREVAEFLAGQTLAVDAETVSFAQNFPRQVLSSMLGSPADLSPSLPVDV
jgi:hypothetical protein